MASEASGTPQQPQQFEVDTSEQSTVYTNFARVNMLPEELVLDFGLNTTLTPNAANPVKLTHRVVMNFYTAKRLLGALHGVVSQHENAFGVLELDLQRRARSARLGQTPALSPSPQAPPPGE